MPSDKPIKAILFDVGGPLVDESAGYERLMTMLTDNISRETGKIPDPAEMDIAFDSAVKSFAPSFIRAVLWHFLKPDIDATKRAHRNIKDEFFAVAEPVTLMPGILDVVRELSEKYILALAGNQVSSIRERLEPTGILKYFKSTIVSEDLRMQKPDSRFFLKICELIDIPPRNCVMVGDRIDNDIFPANILGIRTVWIKAGPHAIQEPRIPEDVPDAVIDTMPQLVPVLEGWEKELKAL